MPSAGEVHRQCCANVSQCAGAQRWNVSSRLRIAWQGHRCARHSSKFHRQCCPPVPENDITPHCHQCAPVTALKLRLVAPTAYAPCGWRQQALCQILPLESGRPPSALPGRCRALRAAVSRPGGVPTPGHWSGAARIVLSCGLRPWMGCAPPTLGASPASRLRPCVGLPVCPPRGRPQPNAMSCRGNATQRALRARPCPFTTKKSDCFRNGNRTATRVRFESTKKKGLRAFLL